MYNLENDIFMIPITLGVSFCQRDEIRCMVVQIQMQLVWLKADNLNTIFKFKEFLVFEIYLFSVTLHFIHLVYAITVVLIEIL